MLSFLKIAMLGAGLTTIYAPQILKDEEEIVEEEPSEVETEGNDEEPSEVETEGNEEEPSEDVDEEPSETEEDFLATVILGNYGHGKVVADILEGKEGDICVLNVDANLLYKIDCVSVNGTNLIEDENIKGKYTFVLSAGENVVDAKFIIDEELCGSLTDIIKEAENKDWENLFSLENVFTIIKWVIDGGVLIAVIRYYIKDKKLENKVEDSVKQTINEIIPENTRQSVVSTLQTTIEPLFEKLALDNEQVKETLSSFAKCLALSQENTPEAKLAIIDELSKVKFGDSSINEKVREFINESTSKLREEFQATIDSLNKISENNETIINEVEVEVEENKEIF